jgi:uncharacterized membrane protein
VTARKYLVLLAVTVFGSLGNVCLARGMRAFGAVTRANSHLLLMAFTNLWVIAGIALLILFFISYLNALSWADLTYVLPATAFGYVLTALLAQMLLREGVPLSHWIGILLITVGVGFVATGPSVTTTKLSPASKPKRPSPSVAAFGQDSGSGA